MKRSILVRSGALVAMASSVAYATLGLVAQVGWRWQLNLPEVIQFGYYRLEPLFLLCVMAAIALLHFLQREHYASFFGSLPRPHAGRLLGALVFLLAFGGVAMILVERLSALVSPEAVTPFWLFFIGVLVATVGIISYGVLTIGTGVMPWWCGVAIMAGSPLSSFVLYLFGDLEWLLGVPWALVGYAIFRTVAGQREEQPLRVR
jgi:hypothetical protein